jgi:hypothetical protein
LEGTTVLGLVRHLYIDGNLLSPSVLSFKGLFLAPCFWNLTTLSISSFPSIGNDMNLFKAFISLLTINNIVHFAVNEQAFPSISHFIHAIGKILSHPDRPRHFAFESLGFSNELIGSVDNESFISDEITASCDVLSSRNCHSTIASLHLGPISFAGFYWDWLSQYPTVFNLSSLSVLQVAGFSTLKNWPNFLSSVSTTLVEFRFGFRLHEFISYILISSVNSYI